MAQKLPNPPPTRFVNDSVNPVTMPSPGRSSMICPPWRQSGHKLTGKKRHRVGFKKRLVLQVQEEYYLYQWSDIPPNKDDPSVWKTRWRDATIYDTTNGEIV